VTIRFGAELTYNRLWEDDIRAHLGRHSYDFTIGSVHDWPGSPYRDKEGLAAWVTGRSDTDVVEPYLAEILGAARSGLFDAIGHLDVVKRYVARYVPVDRLAAASEVYEPVLQALIETGTALEVNTSGLRQAPGETYPTAAIVAMFRDLGGTAVTAGSDAHRAATFAFGLEDGYRLLAEAGFEELAFGRVGRRVGIGMPVGRTWS
jgi:histidinol-phosphatase (PHP family)